MRDTSHVKLFELHRISDVILNRLTNYCNDCVNYCKLPHKMKLSGRLISPQRKYNYL